MAGGSKSFAQPLYPLLTHRFQASLSDIDLLAVRPLEKRWELNITAGVFSYNQTSWFKERMDSHGAFIITLNDTTSNDLKSCARTRAGKPVFFTSVYFCKMSVVYAFLF